MTETSDLSQMREILAGMLTQLDQKQAQQEKKTASAGSSVTAAQDQDGRPIPAAFPGHARAEQLLEEISRAYERLVATRRKLSGAEAAKRRHEQRIRVDNMGALTAARNERSEKLHLEKLLDTDRYRKILAAREQAELDHFDARAEVDRLQLSVRLLRAVNPEGSRSGDHNADP